MNSLYTPGNLVQVRKRLWVVLPAADPEVVRLRPLIGDAEQEIGLYLPLEKSALEPATFPLPEPKPGDPTGSLLLFDAARLSLRSGATPFRSLGHLSVVPRPYQFVPLIMALRLNPVRLLIADDVGVGKTIEAALIARELLDRGIARRLAVICPAHLCDQWERELREKFVLEPAVIQPSRIARLERNLPRPDLSIYQYYPYMVVSLDFIKGERHRGFFLQNAPDLVIVDEAHLVTRPRGQEARQHQRYALVKELAADPARHLVLVTATPHSGIEESFRSLLGMLHPRFEQNPEIPGSLDRQALVPHLVQRRRQDIEHWLGAETPFPERQSQEMTYSLSDSYQKLFQEVLDYCRETVASGRTLRFPQQRVRHWAALALLRCVLSSPEAAVAVLTSHATGRGFSEITLLDTPEQVDDLYRPQVLDTLGEEEIGDYTPRAPVEDAEIHLSEREKRLLRGFLAQAERLKGPAADLKLAKVTEIIRGLLQQQHRPIVFCRFIPTAKYLAAWLQELLAAQFPEVRVLDVTGEVGEEERRERVGELAQHPFRVLVATDCLSEGINLQEHFDAVVHYDLPWNPNRLEQREGRVDRFGQRRPLVRTVLLYGENNLVDLVVLEVLIRKAKTIQKALGITVPVPVRAEEVLQAVMDTVLLRRPRHPRQPDLGLTDPEVSRLHADWDLAAEREEEQRAFFCQQGIQPEEVARELALIDPVLGEPEALPRFLANVLQRFNGELLRDKKQGVFLLYPGDLKGILSPWSPSGFPLRVTFDRLKDETALYLGRTHPLVERICQEILSRALGPKPDELFSRTGAMFTRAVSWRTVLLLLRCRYLLQEVVDEFAEEVVVVACRREQGRLVWLEPLEKVGRELLESAQPAANMPGPEQEEHIRWALEFLQSHEGWYDHLLSWRTATLQESHQRLRQLAQAPPLVIQPHTPPDILGLYVLVPAGGQQ